MKKFYFYKRSTSHKMTNIYLVLDALLGNVPKKILIAQVLVGGTLTVSGVVDISLRIVVGLVTIIVGWYTVQNHKQNISATKKKEALDELTLRIKKEELELILSKKQNSE